jgi:hypothetical protein
MRRHQRMASGLPSRHRDRQGQATPRPWAVKGPGYALAVPPLTALAGSGCGSAMRSRWGGQKQDVDLHSNQPEWLSFRALEWPTNRPLQPPQAVNRRVWRVSYQGFVCICLYC